MTMESKVATHITFRPLALADASLLYQWSNMPHIQESYSVPQKMTEEQTVQQLKHHLQKPVSGYIILNNQHPIGYISYYSIADNPWPEQALPQDVIDQGVGLDVLIGDPHSIGKGLGPQIIKQLLAEKIWPQYHYCVVDPEISNKIAIKAFHKLGFKEHKIAKSRSASRPIKLMVLKK